MLVLLLPNNSIFKKFHTFNVHLHDLYPYEKSTIGVDSEFNTDTYS